MCSFVLAVYLQLVATTVLNYRGASAQVDCAHEKDHVTFRTPHLRSRHSCRQLTMTDCKFFHEAARICPCTCSVLETGDRLAVGHEVDTVAEALPVMGGGRFGGGFGGGYVNPYPTYVAYLPETGGGGFGGGFRRRRACLSGDDYVMTETGRRRIADLAASDRFAKVLSRSENDGRLVFSPIVFWIHSRPNDNASYYEVETEDGRRLSLTGEHLIYITDCRNERQRPIMADKLRVGDCVFTVQDEQLGARPKQSMVKAITAVRKSGIYSPVTDVGNVVVNGVVASCYTSIENEPLQKLLYHYAVVVNKIASVLLPSFVYDSLFVPEEGFVPPAVLSMLSTQKYFLG